MKKYMLVLALVAFFSVTAFAGTATGTLTVTSNIVAACTVGSPTLAFGPYDPVGTNATTALSVASTLYYTCTNGASITSATLGWGLHPSGSPSSQRQLSDGAAGTPHYLQYDLYYGTGTSGGTAWSGTASPTLATGTGAQQSIAFYGTIPGANLQTGTLVAGDYSDTVVITFTF